MKTLLIETVSNGWIVRPFQHCADWACTERPAIAVYTDLAALQADLPALLNVAPVAPIEFVTVGPEGSKDIPF